MEKHYDIVLFDLDGTLCETGEGIKTSLRWTFQQLGRPAPDEELLRRFIGPPMRDSFMDFCGMTSTQTEEAVRLFRSHYNETGWLLTRLYPGMQALLCRLREAGARLSTATAKPENMAKRILQHFGVSACFTAVVGALPNGERAVKKGANPLRLGTVRLPARRICGDGGRHPFRRSGRAGDRRGLYRRALWLRHPRGA